MQGMGFFCQYKIDAFEVHRTKALKTLHEAAG
jgi:hypothetical protein